MLALVLGDLGYVPALPALRPLLVGADPGGNLRTCAIVALGKLGTREDLPLLRTVIAADPFRGEGAWASDGREAISRIEKRHRQ